MLLRSAVLFLLTTEVVGLVPPRKPERATRPRLVVTPSKAAELLALGAFSVALYDVGALSESLVVTAAPPGEA